MERKIGEIFEYNGEWYQCVKDTTDENCDKCSFHCYCNFDVCGFCSSDSREDKQSVCFKKLEKVGEPFRFSGSLIFQKYVLPISNPAYKGDRSLFFSAPSDTFMYVKLEQNQENMEEKKLNLKPFDLEKAKAGKPVCTRDGRKARIICFNRAGYNMFPIVALIMNGDKESDIYTYRPNGTWDNNGNESEKDLMMLPEKHEGWVNVLMYMRSGEYSLDNKLFGTEDEAVAEVKKYATDFKYVATVKICWEE